MTNLWFWEIFKCGETLDIDLMPPEVVGATIIQFFFRNKSLTIATNFGPSKNGMR
jgi:hypothetical protein